MSSALVSTLIVLLLFVVKHNNKTAQNMDLIAERITRIIPKENSTHCGTGTRLRVNKGGNYCGHEPSAPRFFKTTIANRPQLLTKAREKMAEFYSKPFNHFELNSAYEILKQKKKRIPVKKIRKMRSERREAVTSVMGFLLDGMDILSRQVFNNPSIEKVAKNCNISIKRAERAMTDLITAGYIHVRQVRERNAEGKWQSKSAIKTINLKVFKILGLSAWYGYEKEKRAKKNTRKKGNNSKTSFKNMNQIASAFNTSILERNDFINYMKTLVREIEPVEHPDPPIT